MTSARPRTALVTGGARRIGRAICLELARAGFRVAVHHARSGAEARALADSIVASGGAADTFAADLAHPAGPGALAEQVTGRFGGVDAVVHNASRYHATPLLASAPEQVAADADLFHALHVRAPLLLVRALAPEMVRRGGGRIVLMGDLHVDRPPAGYGPYVASKAGLHALVRSLARELAPEVQVNGVAPGAILPPEGAAEGVSARLARDIPAGRLGRPEEVADAVRWLLTGPDYVTGEVVGVDGGA